MKALTVACIVFTILTIISHNKASDDFHKIIKYEIKDPRKPQNPKVYILNSRKQEYFKKKHLKQLRAKRRNDGDVAYTTFDSQVGPHKFPAVFNKPFGVRTKNEARDWQRFADPLGLVRNKRNAPQAQPKNVKVVQKAAVKPKPKAGPKVRRQPKPKSNAQPSQNPAVQGLTKISSRSLRGGHRKRHSKSKKTSHKRRGRKHRSRSKALRQDLPKKTVQESRRLIAAKDCQIEDYPYVVSIQKRGEHWCGGALLNPRLVITTANCVWKSEHFSRMKVRAGSRLSSTGGQTARIQMVMKHPDWSIRSAPNCDVAIILLDRDIKFSDKVHGADLPNQAMMPPFEDAWVTSWGSERRDGIYNDNDVMTLQAIHSYVMSNEECNNITQRFGVAVNENFLCFAQTGRRAPCTRDTGAPAVSDGVVWGLASWGIRKLCGTERFPAMFSYLGSEANQKFIMNATKVFMSEMRESPFLDRFPYREPVIIPQRHN